MQGEISPALALRRRFGQLMMDALFTGATTLGRLHPKARPERYGVEVVRDVAYGPLGRANLLDIYRPSSGQKGGAKLPAVLYIHGGGFRILSKDTHWMMALPFARRGYVVFNINYRLAPENPYPAAIEDACRAYQWVAANLETWGGDPERFVLAGESAGANLASATAAALSYPRKEAWAAPLFGAALRPKAVVANCGLFQVSNTQRFLERRRLPAFIADRMFDVEHSYLPQGHAYSGEALHLADPVVLIEEREPEKPLPPFFLPVGTKDPILPDNRRMADALRQRGVFCEDRYYPGEVHAFQTMAWRSQARACWRDTFAFLDRFLAESVTKGGAGT
jgi:acetyl esterase